MTNELLVFFYFNLCHLTTTQRPITHSYFFQLTMIMYKFVDFIFLKSILFSLLYTSINNPNIYASLALSILVHHYTHSIIISPFSIDLYHFSPHILLPVNHDIWETTNHAKFVIRKYNFTLYIKVRNRLQQQWVKMSLVALKLYDQ